MNNQQTTGLHFPSDIDIYEDNEKAYQWFIDRQQFNPITGICRIVLDSEGERIVVCASCHGVGPEEEHGHTYNTAFPNCFVCDNCAYQAENILRTGEPIWDEMEINFPFALMGYYGLNLTDDGEEV